MGRRAKKNWTGRERRIMALALFWRYGYFALMVLLSLFSSRLRLPGYVPFLYIILYGLYTLALALAMPRHFICGMQNAGHEKMNPRAGRVPRRQYRKTGLFIGGFFLALGVAGLVCEHLGW